VAHDLKQPLGVIVEAAEFLEKDPETLSVEELREHLRRIRRAGKKMRPMIEELLLLASVRYTPVPRELVTIRTIVEAALERLTLLVTETSARIHLPESWPTVLGHGPWLKEAWASYLSSALQSSGPGVWGLLAVPSVPRLRKAIAAPDGQRLPEWLILEVMSGSALPAGVALAAIRRDGADYWIPDPEAGGMGLAAPSPHGRTMAYVWGEVPARYA
jgi:signal transduction histidine kinase